MAVRSTKSAFGWKVEIGRSSAQNIWGKIWDKKEAKQSLDKSGLSLHQVGHPDFFSLDYKL